MTLNQKDAINVAFEITKLAVEKNYILADQEPKKAAQNISDFYKELVEQLQKSND